MREPPRRTAGRGIRLRSYRPALTLRTIQSFEHRLQLPEHRRVGPLPLLTGIGSLLLVCLVALKTLRVSRTIEQSPLACQAGRAPFHTGAQTVADGIDPAHDVSDSLGQVCFRFSHDLVGNLVEVLLDQTPQMVGTLLG